MNIVITLVLLVMSVLALQYNAYVLFLALIIAALVSTPRAWLYTLLTAVVIFALRYVRFPSWDVLSFLVIAVMYSLMSKVEERKEKTDIPPELLYYYLLSGGGNRAP